MTHVQELSDTRDATCSRHYSSYHPISLSHALMQVLSDPVSHSGIQSDNQTDTHLHQQHFLFPRGFSFSQCACEVGTFNSTGHQPVSLECRTFVGHLPSAKFPQYIMARSEIIPLFGISNPKKNVEKLETSK